MGIISFFKEVTWDLVFGRKTGFWGLMEKVLGLFLTMTLIGLAVLISMLFFALINEVAFEEVKNVPKQMVAKKLSPAHTQILPMQIGKSFIYIPHFIPDQRYLCFQFAQEVVCGEVGEGTYDNAKIGMSYEVSYGVGRLDGKHIVKSISKQK